MLSILLIEDYLPDVALIKAFLEEASFKHKFFHSTSLRGGLTILRENEIDVVLLDLSLSDSVGFNTLKKFLKETPDTPVIVLTGLKNEVVGMQSVKAGAQDFLVKDEFDSKRLVKSIRYSQQRWKAKAELEKKAKALQIDKSRYEKAQEMVKFGDWEMDIVDNSMKWTDEMFRIFGFAPQSFTPTLSDYLNYVHFEDREKVDQFFDRAIQETILHRLEHRIIVSGRTIKYLIIHAKVSFDEYNNKILLIGGVQDISDRKSAKGAVVPSEPLILKPQLLTSLLSPVHPKMTTEVLQSMAVLDKIEVEPNQLPSNWKKHFWHLLESYSNLFQFSLLKGNKPEINPRPVEVKSLVESLQKTIHSMIDSGPVILSFLLSDRLSSKVKADPDWLNQVIMLIYLLHEDRPINQRETKVIMDLVGEDEFSPSLQIEIIGEFDYIQTLPSNYSERSLIKYLENYPTDDKRILRLIALFRIVHILGGTCSIKLQSNDLSNILIDLPVQSKPVSEEMPLPATENKTTNARILIAEDHSINRLKMKKMLTDWSGLVTVREAENGREAIELVEKEKFDLIFMDLKMPVMDGLEASSNIRKDSNTPIVALTTDVSDNEKEACESLGINAYLLKPLKFEKLISTINSFLK